MIIMLRFFSYVLGYLIIQLAFIPIRPVVSVIQYNDGKPSTHYAFGYALGFKKKVAREFPVGSGANDSEHFLQRAEFSGPREVSHLSQVICWVVSPENRIDIIRTEHELCRVDLS